MIRRRLRRLFRAWTDRRPADPEQAEAKADAAEDARVRARLDDLVTRIRGKVPADIQLRVEQIRERILAILPKSRETSGGDPALPLLRQTAEDYLPNAVDRYLLLPPMYALQDPVRDGRTAHDLLMARLDEMLQRLRDIEDAINRRASRDLQAYAHFLEERFRTDA